MKLFYWVHKLIRMLVAEGLRETLREFIYFNRTQVIIEKRISQEAQIIPKTMQAIIVTADNYLEYQRRLKINLYLCKRGATGLLLCQGSNVLGFQFWTRDERLNVLNKFGISIEKKDAYLFDFFVFPRYRGTKVPKIISSETHNFLISRGVNRIFGIFFMDNIKSLWWHRAILKCKEIRRVTSSQFLIFEIYNGKLRFNL